MTAKMTRAEFMRTAASLSNLTAYNAALLAERAGVEWVPEPVEPVVGDLLTEHTRLVNDVVVVTLGGVAWQYDGHVWLCVGSTITRTTTEMVRQGARIVYIPGGES